MEVFHETIETVDKFLRFVYKLRKENNTKIMDCSLNSILNGFSMLCSTDIKKLHNTFSMSVSSSELVELSDKYMELINIAYCKVTRHLYKLP